MSRYRLYPTTAQEAALLEHCAHARFVWNLAVEQRLCGSLAATQRQDSPSNAGSSPKLAPHSRGWRMAA